MEERESERGERNRVLGARIASRANELLAESDFRREAIGAETSIDSGGEEREKQRNDQHRTELAILSIGMGFGDGFLWLLWIRLAPRAVGVSDE